MKQLRLKDITLSFPNKINFTPTDIEIEEWLRFELGITKYLNIENSLSALNLKDCRIRVYGAAINDKPVII